MLLTVGRTSYTVTVAAPSGVQNDLPPLLDVRPASDPAARDADACVSGSVLRADLSELTSVEGCTPRVDSHSSTDSERSLESERQPSRRGKGADLVAAELAVQLSAGVECSARCGLTTSRPCRLAQVAVHMYCTPRK